MWGWLAGVYAVLDVIGAVLPWLLVAVSIGWLVAAAWEGRDRTPGAFAEEAGEGPWPFSDRPPGRSLE